MTTALKPSFLGHIFVICLCPLYCSCQWYCRCTAVPSDHNWEFEWTIHTAPPEWILACTRQPLGLLVRSWISMILLKYRHLWCLLTLCGHSWLWIFVDSITHRKFPIKRWSIGVNLRDYPSDQKSWRPLNQHVTAPEMSHAASPKIISRLTERLYRPSRQTGPKISTGPVVVPICCRRENGLIPVDVPVPALLLPLLNKTVSTSALIVWTPKWGTLNGRPDFEIEMSSVGAGDHNPRRQCSYVAIALHTSRSSFIHNQAMVATVTGGWGKSELPRLADAKMMTMVAMWSKAWGIEMAGRT